MNGCHNRRALSEQVEVQDGWTITGARRVIRIPSAMQRDCQYTKSTLGQADAGCLGCRHRSTNPPESI